MFDLMIIEDNASLGLALCDGFLSTNQVRIVNHFTTGEQALEYCLKIPPHVILMDVQLAGEWNGIQTAVAIRKEFPRLPIVFYSIQDEDRYYRDFQNSGILSHYAYVRKSNYLLPVQLIPLLQDAINGRSFIDPEIELRVHEVRFKDEQNPFSSLEPVEKAVAKMIAQGYTNEQIADQLGFRDKRSISRINGQIYAAWGLDTSSTDEKIARTRAALIALTSTMLTWDDSGNVFILNEQGVKVPWTGYER